MNVQQSEESLKESEELYRFLVENTPDGFFIAEVPSGKLSFLNSRLCEIFGISPEQAGGVSIWNGLSPEEHEIVSERIYKSLNNPTPSPRRYTYTMRRMDGTTFKGEVSLSNMMFRGKMVIQGIVRDVTEQMRLQDQLRHAQKMEAIGTLAGGIAHEFNNLMQAVSGYTELLLLNKSLDSPSKQKLEAIRKSTQRASELTRQILIFSQKVESKLQTVKLNHEVMRIFKLLKKTLPKMIEVKVSSDEHIRDIQADPALIGQILMNLSINARDAMPDGGTLFISTSDVFLDEQYYRHHPELRPGHYALLSVSDTGCGMNKETMQHLFEPFYTTKGTGKGTGLGLAMAYGIVREHGGHILCYSEIGMGTTFRIYLPATEPPKDIPEPAPEKYHGGSETILLADDEDFIRNSGKELLERFGYTVLLASDGEQALEIFRQKSDKIHLVMLDLLMPGMGGKKCLEEILAIHPSAKILIASGYSQNKITTEAMNIGAAEFIGKPYQVGELLKIIRKILDNKGEKGMTMRSFGIYDMIERNAALSGGQTALVCGSTRISFEEFMNKTKRLASALSQRGIVKGDRIAILAHNCHDFFYLFGAAAALGAVVVAINWRLSDDEIRYILSDSSPKLLAADSNHAHRVKELGMPFVAGIGNCKDYPSLKSLMTDAAFSKPNIGADDPFCIIYTAAVAGKPRGAVLTHGNMIAANLQTAATMGLTDKDVCLSNLPLFHITGLNLAFAVMHVGGKNVVIEKFDEKQCLELTQTEKVSVMGSFPPILSRLTAEANAKSYNLSSLRIVLGIDGPDNIVPFEKKTSAKFWILYGQSETSGLVTFSPASEKPGSAGKIGLLSKVKIVNEKDIEMPLGESGEIVVQGPLVFQGYLNQEEANRYTFRNNWHHTGDWGVLDKDGYLWFKGRKPEKELIKPGGENVYPAEVEEVILQHSDIADVSVIGVPDAQFGEGIKAVCVLKAGKTLSEKALIEFVADRIARYKKPRYVAFADSLPKTSDGRVDREKVKQLYGK